MAEFMNMAIVCTGYMGLITGLGLAELGNEVINVDIDAGKIELLDQGRAPIHEEGVDLNIDLGMGLLGTERFGLLSSGWGHMHGNSLLVLHSRRGQMHCTVQALTSVSRTSHT